MRICNLIVGLKGLNMNSHSCQFVSLSKQIFCKMHLILPSFLIYKVLKRTLCGKVSFY